MGHFAGGSVLDAVSLQRQEPLTFLAAFGASYGTASFRSSKSADGNIFNLNLVDWQSMWHQAVILKIGLWPPSDRYTLKTWIFSI